MDYFTASLIITALLGVWVIFRVEKADNQFTWLDMMKDENGKPSILRPIIPLAWAVTSVVLLYTVRHDDPEDFYFFCMYIAVWSGAPIAGKAIEAVQTIWGKKGT